MSKPFDRNERLGHLTGLTSVLHGAWPHFAAELEHLREHYVTSLVTVNSEEVRGKVKMIDELLRLPNTLRQEMDNLAQSLPE